MAEGVLGLGTGAASLNNELIEKLKEAERASTVAPIETSIEDIEGETGESAKVQEIIDKANLLLETLKPFDLFVTGGQTAFDSKTANTTGTSAVFDAVDASVINEGTTTVHIAQLAQRDVFQTDKFTDSEAIIPSSAAMIINGETFTTQGEDFTALAEAIDLSGNFTASFASETLTINMGNGDKTFTTTNKTYEEVSAEIEAHISGDFTSSIPAETLSGDILTLSQSGRPVYQSDTKISEDDIVDASGTGTITIDSEVFTISSDMTYSQLVEEINNNENFNAKITILGRLSITSSDEKSELSIVENLTSNTGLSRGEKYSTEDISYKDLAKNINSNSNYIATVEAVGTNENRIVIKSVESGLDNKIDITQTGIDLGLDLEANNTVKAQNLEAVVNGVDYNVSSNILIVDGGLKITAVEEDEVGKFSSIAVNNDTTTIEPALQDFVTIYNELVSLVDEELYSSESNIEDKATLRTMMSSIKDTLFGSYGSENNLNIFNFGFEIDKSGVLSLDSATFNEAIETDAETLKSLFIGVAENRGLGTQLKEYVDALDGFEGLLSTYQENIDTRKEALEEEKEKAIETLDNKYSSLAAQFAAYNTLINEFEAQFSGLKLMIEQSVASS